MGTDNGRVELTRDDARSWQNVTPPGVPDWSMIDIIDASATDPATAYLAVDRHRADDFRPIAYRTHDYGATWTEIDRGLPDGAWVGVVRQDTKQANLLYAGTSRGVWVSFDDGDNWQSLELDLPTTGINDLAPHGDDLVAGTEGRAIWILDQLAPLRALAARGPSAEPTIYPPGIAYRVRADENKDTPLPPEEPRGENPPPGAVLDYVLPATTSGPVALEIVDDEGQTVRRFASDDAPEKVPARVYFTDLFLGPSARIAATPGHHRFVWNLRYPRPRALSYSYSIAAVPGRETPALPEGAFVLPGRYRVRLTADGRTIEQALEVKLDPRVDVPRAALDDLLEFQRQVAKALQRSAELAAATDRATTRLEAALADPRASVYRKRIERVKADLAGLASGREQSMTGANRALASVAANLEEADAPPTDAERQVLSDYSAGIDRFEAKWRAFASGPLAELDRKLEKLGSLPPTAGANDLADGM